MQDSLRDSIEFFKNCLRIKLNLRTTYYPQADGHGEGTIRTIEEMLKVCSLDFNGKLGLTFALRWNFLTTIVNIRALGWLLMKP